MSTCPNCQYISKEPVAFCEQCGTAMTQPATELSSAETVSAPSVCADTAEAAPQPLPKRKSIPGMVLSISSLLFSLEALVMQFVISFFMMIGNVHEWFVVFMFLGNGTFSFVLALIGFIMSRKGENGFARAGRACGMIGCFFSVVVTFLQLYLIWYPYLF